MSKKEAKYVERIEGRALGNRPIANKTEIRISVKIPQKDRKLFNFEKFVRKHGRERDVRAYMKSMGLSAVRGVADFSDKELMDFANNTRTKEGTWWLYDGTIEPKCIAAVHFLTPDGYRDYNFETHGRQICSDAGLVAPSVEALAELSEIFPREGKFYPNSAFCFCEKDGDYPSITIRREGRDTKIGLALKDGRLKSSNSDCDVLLYKWIEKHCDELADCWDKAAAVCRRVQI